MKDSFQEYPVFLPFVEWMENSYRGKFGKEHLSWLDSYPTEDTLFASFILTYTGSWKSGSHAKKVAATAIENDTNIETIADNPRRLSENIASCLEEIDDTVSRNEWIHGHRHEALRLGFGFDWKDISRNAVTEWTKFHNSGGYSSAEAWLDDARTQDEDTFFHMYDNFNPWQASRVTRFDFLEIANRAGGIEDLYPPPDEARRAYVKSNDPKHGFMIVFCSEEPTIEAAKEAIGLGWWKARSRLDRNIEEIDELLQDTANFLVERGWSRKTVVFDLESCFCIFAKEADYKDVLNEMTNK